MQEHPPIIDAEFEVVSPPTVPSPPPMTWRFRFVKVAQAVGLTALAWGALLGMKFLNRLFG